MSEMKISDLSNESGPEREVIFAPLAKVQRNYTLDEIADKVAELALVKVLAKLEQLNSDD